MSTRVSCQDLVNRETKHFLFPVYTLCSSLPGKRLNHRANSNGDTVAVIVTAVSFTFTSTFKFKFKVKRHSHSHSHSHSLP